jgi:hypothetical protein
MSDAFQRQNMVRAIEGMSLSDPEQNLYTHHLTNLYGPGKVVQPNQDISTVLQSVVTGPDGKFYSIPTVWDGKVLPPDQASKKAASVGWDKWPSYDTPEAADARYMQMHDYMNKDVWQFLMENER